MSNLSPRTLEQLKSLAERLERDHRYMSWALTRYQAEEKLSDIKLAEIFRTTPEMLLRLALCKYPDPESTSFISQVKQIASYTNIELTSLVNLIRQVESLEALSNQPTPDLSENLALQRPMVFAAARDKENTNDAEPPKSSDKLEDSEQDSDEDGNVAKQ